MSFRYQEILSKDDIEQIHQTSMKLLANVGVRFPEDEGLYGRLRILEG